MLDISKEGSFAAEVMSFMTAGLTVDSKFQDFPGFSRFFSRTYAFFQDFPGPGILNNKIPGLSRICTNPGSLQYFATTPTGKVKLHQQLEC